MTNRKVKRCDRRETSARDAGILVDLVQALVALAVVAAGILAARYLIKMKKPPRQTDPNSLAPLVEAQRIAKRDMDMIIKGHGTVRPKVKVEIIPEVPGKLVHVHPQFKVGGLIPAKEKILKIDPRDYELAVQQANAAVADAEVRLDTEKAEADVARQEWEKLHPGEEPTSPLVLRLPQIRTAESALESAKAQLAVAQLKLERTTISLPFDAIIVSERADLSQYVVTGQSLGVANGIKSVEIEVPLEDEELKWFDVFDNSLSNGSDKSESQCTPALVKAVFAGAEHTWEGCVVRTTGQVDTTSRMVSVVVEVPNPFDRSDGKPPLLPGVFTEVLIKGKALEDVVAIPRDAVREGNKVWVVVDGRLKIISLKIARADKEFAYVTSELDDGALIITSSLDIVIDGMDVRVRVQEEASAGVTARIFKADNESEAN